jgi:MEDS: MEthanogen/methylotroph, DcmR Sensory domain
MTPMATETRTTGIDVVGDMVAWGAHFCFFYETRDDLVDTLISYCKSGLESEEYCLWIVAEPLTVDEARDALKNAVPGLDRYLADSRLEIRRPATGFSRVARSMASDSQRRGTKSSLACRPEATPA